MVYQNRPAQESRTTSTPGSVRPQPVITPQSRPGNCQRESLRIPITRRIVSIPSSSHSSPVVGSSINFLLFIFPSN